MNEGLASFHVVAALRLDPGKPGTARLVQEMLAAMTGHGDVLRQAQDERSGSVFERRRMPAQYRRRQREERAA